VIQTQTMKTSPATSEAHRAATAHEAPSTRARAAATIPTNKSDDDPLADQSEPLGVDAAWVCVCG
jgi:hypothetical protein